MSLSNEKLLCTESEWAKELYIVSFFWTTNHRKVFTAQQEIQTGYKAVFTTNVAFLWFILFKNNRMLKIILWDLCGNEREDKMLLKREK